LKRALQAADILQNSVDYCSYRSEDILRATDFLSVALLFFEQLKSKPAVRVPPNAILLPGSKSMQKCLLLAEGNILAGWRKRL
jgi:hypothetical protein